MDERPARRARRCRGRERQLHAPEPQVRHEPTFGRVGQFQGAAKALHGLVHDGQPEAGAGGRRARGVAAEERCRQVGQLLGGHTRALIAHAHDRPRPRRHRRHRDLGQAGFGAATVTARVLEQVQEDAAEFGLVAEHLQVCRHARLDADLRRVAQRCGLAVDELRHSDRHQPRLARARVVHELVDDGVELVDVQRHVAPGFLVLHAHLGFQPQPRQRRAQVVADAGQHHGAVFLHARQFARHAVEAPVDLADLAGERVSSSRGPSRRRGCGWLRTKALQRPVDEARDAYRAQHRGRQRNADPDRPGAAAQRPGLRRRGLQPVAVALDRETHPQPRLVR